MGTWVAQDGGEGDVGFVEVGDLKSLVFDGSRQEGGHIQLAAENRSLVGGHLHVDGLTGGRRGAGFKGIDDGPFGRVDEVDDKVEDLVLGVGRLPCLDDLDEAFAIGAGRTGAG